MLSIQQSMKNRMTVTSSLSVNPYTGGFNNCDLVDAIAPQGDFKIPVGVQGILG
jgi:hypothetical protein